LARIPVLLLALAVLPAAALAVRVGVLVRVTVLAVLAAAAGFVAVHLGRRVFVLFAFVDLLLLVHVQDVEYVLHQRVQHGWELAREPRHVQVAQRLEQRLAEDDVVGPFRLGSGEEPPGELRFPLLDPVGASSKRVDVVGRGRQAEQQGEEVRGDGVERTGLAGSHQEAEVGHRLLARLGLGLVAQEVGAHAQRLDDVVAVGGFVELRQIRAAEEGGTDAGWCIVG